MVHSDGSNVDRPLELDDEDVSPPVRRFLESIAEGDSSGASPADRRRTVDRERRVSRFAWTCEELNVAFGDLRVDEGTTALLREHGVRATLAELQAKCGALLAAIDAHRAD